MAMSPRDNIPSPRGLPWLGNILELEDDLPINQLERLCNIFGPICKLNMMGRDLVIIGSVALLDEVCNEKLFAKGLPDELDTQKDTDKTPQGLFSVKNEHHEDWQVAHRVMMPAFGPLAMQEMFPEMHDLASQLVLKWARMGSSNRIAATSDFTKLTLDTIALCAMDYRFNSFYQDATHPFVGSLNRVLLNASKRAQLGPRLRKMMPWDTSGEAVKPDQVYTYQVAVELLKVRRDNPTDKQDLLNAMINGKDPKTGASMSDGLITTNMLTFLTAGHETTAGLLSFVFLYLLKNPATYFKAQQEVDHVLGGRKLTPRDLKDLKYINAVLRETLRLSPSAPTFTRIIRPDSSNPDRVQLLAQGKYEIRRNDKILCVMPQVHRDPEVYGEDANEFKPDRMLDENFVHLPQSAWKPFGTGARACIGRPFAWQEALIAIALILQNFDLRLDDPDGETRIKQAITIKPEEYYMRATLRRGVNAQSIQSRLFSEGSAAAMAAEVELPPSKPDDIELAPVTILYGSNTGTCQSLAQQLSIRFQRCGLKPNIMDMDASVGKLPNNQPIVIITSSYEGEPPDNASQFFAWLETLQGIDCLNSVAYAVFGCGNRDWVQTYQRIPILVNEMLAQHGARRLADLTYADAQEDISGAFDTWASRIIALVTGSGLQSKDVSQSSLEMEISTQSRSTYLRQDMRWGSVVKACRLTAPSEPEKRHLKIKLPKGVTYQSGDYLAILPMNREEEVDRALRLFQISREATIKIKPGEATFLPTGDPISVVDLLRGYVELNQPVTKVDVQACIAACKKDDKACLETLTEESFPARMAAQGSSLLELLMKYKSIELTFGAFLAFLPPLRPRYFSISSSPLADPQSCTITYGVINEAARSGNGQFVGVTGAYLSNLKEGDDLLVSVRATNRYFRLPTDPKTPILMFGSGTGLAPFRSFIEERAVQIAAGKSVAPALMIMGCRSLHKDRLYADQIDEWARIGAVDVRYAFSREPEMSEGCKYIQDRFLHDAEDLRRLWQEGAKVFTCCSPTVAHSLGEAAKELLIRTAKETDGKDVSEEEAAAWFKNRLNERVVVDVFA